MQALDISDITGSGFPFLRGSVSVETEVDLVETDYRLRCAGRVQFVRVFVNDQPAGLLLFEQVLDLSAFLRPGRNRIRLELMASNRNLLGPFHCAGEPEPDAVGPDTFSNYGSWQDSTSPHYTPDYAFVRFGLDTFQLEK